MAETNLRQANTSVSAVGKVAEKNLKVETKDGKTYITGYVAVKTSDTNVVRFNVRSNEKKNDGTENKTYKGIQTVMNEFKSIAEFGEDGADTVRVTGDLNLFTGKNGNPSCGYRGSFFNRIPEGVDAEFSAEFSVEVFIESIVDEHVMEDGEPVETGRALVKGWVPTYNGIEPITLVAEEDIADDLKSGYSSGDTVEFLGDVINSSAVIVKTIPVAIGKPRTSTQTVYKNELVITGASAPYEEEGGKKPYDRDTINAAKEVREENLRAAQAAGNSSVARTNNSKPSANAMGRSAGFLSI